MNRRARAPLTFAVLGIGLALQAAALAYVVLLPEGAGALGVAHPTHAGLRIAPEAFQRTEHLRTVTQLYGAGVLGTLLALLALGLGGGAPLRSTRATWAFALAAAGIIGSYVAIWCAYANGAGAPEIGILGLPAATAWFLLGLWPAEALFALVFMLHFRRAYWTPEAEARFADLLAARRAGAREASAERSA